MEALKVFGGDRDDSFDIGHRELETEDSNEAERNEEAAANDSGDAETSADAEFEEIEEVSQPSDPVAEPHVAHDSQEE